MRKVALGALLVWSAAGASAPANAEVCIRCSSKTPVGGSAPTFDSCDELTYLHRAVVEATTAQPPGCHKWMVELRRSDEKAGTGSVGHSEPSEGVAVVWSFTRAQLDEIAEKRGITVPAILEQVVASFSEMPGVRVSEECRVPDRVSRTHIHITADRAKLGEYSFCVDSRNEN